MVLPLPLFQDLPTLSAMAKYFVFLEWTFPKPASDFIRTNRASVQLAIQVLSALLALIHSAAVCNLVANSGRLRLASRGSFTMGQLRGWAQMAAPKMALNVPMLYFILASLVTSLSIISAAFWVGVMTPVEGRAFSNGTIAIPSFANLSLMGEYPSEAKLPEGQRGAPESFTEYGFFTYKAGPRPTSRLPNSTIEKYSSYFGMTPKAIVAMGVAAGIRRPRYVGIAAGEFYKQLNTIQCEMEFRPARFNVTVGLTNRTISVSNPARDGRGRGEVAETDPSGLWRAPCSLALGRGSSITTNSTDEAEYTLRGVENSLIAMADDMLALYGAAQLMVGNFERRTTVGVTLSVLKLGVWQYALAVAALNAAVVVEVARTSGWRAMPSFDFTDMGWLLPAAFRGGSLDVGGNRRGSHDEFEAVAWKGEGLSLLAGETQDMVVQL
ncbi:hypothetical protein RB598_002298 [Gaeumannomyces tritici]